MTFASDVYKYCIKGGEVGSVPVMYVTDEFVKLHDKYGDFDKIISEDKKYRNIIHSDITLRYKNNSYSMDIKFLKVRPNEYDPMLGGLKN